MTNKILMVTPEDEDVEVEEADFQAALDSKLEPAFEMVDRDGNVQVVRKRHLSDAEKAGMTAKPVWDALNTKTKGGAKVGKAEAFARGFANMTSPLADEAVGFVANPLGGAKAALGLFGVNNADDADVQEYQAKRNAYRERDDEAWDEQGLAYGLGGATGIGAGVFGGGAPVTAAGKAVSAAGARAGARVLPAAGTRVGNLARAGLSGAAMGGVNAAGGGTDAKGQADLATGDVAGVAKQTAIGTGAGFLGGAGGEEAINLLRKSAPAIRTLAERAGYRASGGMKSDINKIYGNTPEDVGRAMLDEGVIPVFGKRAGEEIEGNIRGKLSEFGKRQDAFMEGLDALGEGVPFELIEKRLVAQIDELKRASGVDNKKAAAALQAELDDLRVTHGVNLPQDPGPIDVTPRMRPRGQPALPGATTPPPPPSVPKKNLGFKEALDAKRDFDTGGKYQTRTEAASVEAARTTRRAIKDAIDEAIAGSKAGPEAMTKYKSEREQAKLLRDALTGLTNETNRETARKQMFGLTDSIVGTGAFGTAMAAGMSTPATAALTLATVGGKKLAEKYGDAFSARVLDSAAKLIEQKGFDEGMRALTKIVGADAATQIGIALGQRKQGGKP